MPILQLEHGRNTCDKEMGLNLQNIVFEAKYKINLECGKEDMSISCKSHVLELLHK
jgi:hypothetical protein